MNCSEQERDKGHRATGQFSALAGLCLIVGTLLTLESMGIIEGILNLWPIFPLFLGLGGVWLYKFSHKKEIAYIGFGSFLIQTSLFFFFLNYTSWKLIAKTWPFFVGFLGISTLLLSFFTKRKGKKRWLFLSGLLTIFIAIVFFLVFNLDGSLWPISIIFFGIWLLLVPERSS